MAHTIKKTEHSGARHGEGAYWGPKKEAKKGSKKIGRRNWAAEANRQLQNPCPFGKAA
jgi:hypothetical protein